jgi:hypothetical protein
VSARAGTALALIAVVVAGACGGPRVPLEVGVKEFPSDIIIGAAKAPVPVPVSLVRRPRRTTQVRDVPALPRGPLATPRPLCPDADPLAAPEVEAPNTVAKPPVEGTYYYRNEGDVEAFGLKGKVPAVTTRTIQNVEPGDGSFTFELLDQLTAITYSYLVDATGIYIVKMTQEVNDQTVTFEPFSPMRMAQLPLANGTRWSSAGTDVQTTWVLDGVVGAQRDEDDDGKPDDADGDGVADGPVPKTRVDACGTWLDAWAVRIAGPQDQGGSRFVSGTGSSYEIIGTSAYGTQFGGIALKETLAYDGTVGGQPFHLHYTTTIAQVPAVPK